MSVSMKNDALPTGSPKPGRGKGIDAVRSGMGRRRALARLAGLAALTVLSPLSVIRAADDPLAAAQNLLDSGRTDEAVNRLKRITADDPRNERAFILLGRAYAQAEKPAEALRAFRAALRLNPADTHTRMLADILAQNPIPEGTQSDRKNGRHASSRLDKSARAEREAFLGGKGESPGRSGPLRVVIDAGHGGPDAGGVAASGLREKDVALDLALRTARELQGAGGGLAVFLTRMSDVPMSLAARAACADLYAADLFVSLHAPYVAEAGLSGVHVFFSDAAGGAPDRGARAVADFENRLARAMPGFPRAGWGGIEAGFARQGAAARRAAQSGRLAAAFLEAAGQGPFSGKGAQGPAGLDILSAVDVPALFVAAGFVSDSGDAAILEDATRRGQLAGVLSRGIAAALAACGG